MNYKIVETNSERPDVLLYRDRDEHGNETVVIMAIGDNENENSHDWFASETVAFDSVSMAQIFIKLFDGPSAIKWCEDQCVTFSY